MSYLQICKSRLPREMRRSRRKMNPRNTRKKAHLWQQKCGLVEVRKKHGKRHAHAVTGVADLKLHVAELVDCLKELEPSLNVFCLKRSAFFFFFLFLFFFFLFSTGKKRTTDQTKYTKRVFGYDNVPLIQLRTTYQTQNSKRRFGYDSAPLIQLRKQIKPKTQNEDLSMTMLRWFNFD